MILFLMNQKTLAMFRNGRNYFEEKKVEYNKKKDEQVEIISRQVGFIKYVMPKYKKHN